MITNSDETPAIDVDKLPKVTIRKAGMATSVYKAARASCHDCAGESAKYVKWCSCDGVHGSYCPMWPFRFGIRPETARQRFGERLLDPYKMPPADVDLDELHNAWPAARRPAVPETARLRNSADARKTPTVRCGSRRQNRF